MDMSGPGLGIGYSGSNKAPIDMNIKELIAHIVTWLGNSTDPAAKAVINSKGQQLNEEKEKIITKKKHEDKVWINQQFHASAFATAAFTNEMMAFKALKEKHAEDKDPSPSFWEWLTKQWGLYAKTAEAQDKKMAQLEEKFREHMRELGNNYYAELEKFLENLTARIIILHDEIKNISGRISERNKEIVVLQGQLSEKTERKEELEKKYGPGIKEAKGRFSEKIGEFYDKNFKDQPANKKESFVGDMWGYLEEHLNQQRASFPPIIASQTEHKLEQQEKSLWAKIDNAFEDDLKFLSHECARIVHETAIEINKLEAPIKVIEAEIESIVGKIQGKEEENIKDQELLDKAEKDLGECIQAKIGVENEMEEIEVEPDDDLAKKLMNKNKLK